VGIMYLFTEQLNNWDDWHDIKISVSAFAPLIAYIMQKENLPLAKVENLTPGTNAVFKVGGYAIKFFVPPELHDTTHNGYGKDFNIELFGIKWANDRGVPSPKLITNGIVADKYLFRYMIMEYVHGIALDKIEDRLSYEDKVTIGQHMRNITDKLNLPCENFTPIDIMAFAICNDGWKEEGFPESFLAELSAYLKNFRMGQKVYCHGDLHEGNVLVSESVKEANLSFFHQNIFAFRKEGFARLEGMESNMNVSIIDFADAMYAPAEYELVYIVSSLFGFEKPYMEGYFGQDYAVDDILELCMTWLPVHAWSHGLLAETIGPAQEITSFAVMRERLRDWINRAF